jgi:hypothetical protein
MKRNTLALSVLLLMFLAFLPSCKKCQTCTVFDSQDNELESKKLCGNRQQLDDQRTRAQINAVNIGGDFRCVEVK